MVTCKSCNQLITLWPPSVLITTSQLGRHIVAASCSTIFFLVEEQLITAFLHNVSNATHWLCHADYYPIDFWMFSLGFLFSLWTVVDVSPAPQRFCEFFFLAFLLVFLHSKHWCCWPWRFGGLLRFLRLGGDMAMANVLWNWRSGVY